MLYLIVKKIHVASAIASLCFFLFRGVLMLAESRWQQNAFLRFAPHVVDTILLTSALWLMSLVHFYPFVHSWLTVKVLLLVAYIILGSFALKRGRTRRERGMFFVAALLVFLFIISVARAHHPLGIFSGLLA